MNYTEFQAAIQQCAQDAIIVRTRCSPVIARTKQGVPMVHGYFLTFPRLDAYIEWPDNGIFYAGSHRCLVLCLGFTDRRPLSILELAEQCPAVEPFGKIRWFGLSHMYPTNRQNRKRTPRIYLSKLIWNPQHPLFNQSLLMYCLYHKVPTIIEGRQAIFLTFPPINEYHQLDVQPQTTVIPLPSL